MGRAIVNRAWFCAFTDSEMNQWPAITTKVNSDGTRNLTIFIDDGKSYPVTNIPEGNQSSLMGESENTFQLLTYDKT